MPKYNKIEPKPMYRQLIENISYYGSLAPKTKKEKKKLRKNLKKWRAELNIDLKVAREAVDKVGFTLDADSTIGIMYLALRESCPLISGYVDNLKFIRLSDISAHEFIGMLTIAGFTFSNLCSYNQLMTNIERWLK